MLGSKGFSPILVIVIILIGLTVGTYQVLKGTNFLPKAFEKVQSPSISLAPSSTLVSKAFVTVLPEDRFIIDVLINSPAETAKSIQAKITYPDDLLTVINVDASSFSALLVNWKNQRFNDPGIIELSADFQGQGYKSTGDSALLLRLEFEVKPDTAGKIGKIDFDGDLTQLIRTSDNTVITNLRKKPLEVRITLSGVPKN